MTDEASNRWTIGNVRLFDGRRLHDHAVLAIDGESILDVSTAPAPAEAFDVDGAGGLLMPGLIDAHVHVTSADDLKRLVAHGVTTALDMASHSVERVRSLRDVVGGTDVRTAGPPASAAGGIHTRVMGFPPDSVVVGPEDADRFVAQRVKEGSDYVKIIVDPPQSPIALSADTVRALVRSARAHGLLSVAHAAALSAFELAVAAGVDVVTHTPLDRPVEGEVARRMAEGGTTCVPTLTMMLAVSQLQPGSPAYRPGMDFSHATASVAALRAGGVTVLAGTDANTAPGTVVNVPPGNSLHDELARLVDVGFAPLEALRSVTSATADAFGLADRGAVIVGRRADLVLVSGDPLASITDSRSITNVWVRGRRQYPTTH